MQGVMGQEASLMVLQAQTQGKLRFMLHDMVSILHCPQGFFETDTRSVVIGE